MQPFRAKLLYLLLAGHGFLKKSRILPWTFFSLVSACACNQIVADMKNDDFTVIFKLMLLVGWINESLALFFTVYRRNETCLLANAIFTQLKEKSKVSLVKRLEKITLIILLLLFFSVLAVITLVDAIKPERANYLFVVRVDNLPFVFWLTLAIFKILVTFNVTSLYMNCSVYILSFVSLSLDRLSRIEMLKQLVPRESHLVMQELIKMDKILKQFESCSSLPIFQMITAHFFEITIFLYRQITYDDTSLTIRISSLSLTLMNVLLVFYSIAVISHFQEKVKDAGQSLADLFFVHKLAPVEYILVSLVIEKVKSVTSRLITVWNIVKINRKLILAIYSSFLTISVLLVQMDNGALETNAPPAGPRA